MFEWITELRKNSAFTITTLLLCAAMLALHLISDAEVLLPIWVFGVILLSGAWAVYAYARLFSYVARGEDILLHLSTQSAVKKMSLKTLPLCLGFSLVGVGTLTGYLWGNEGDSQATSSDIVVAMFGKLLGIVALVACAWLLARLVKPLRSFGAQLTAFGAGWIVLLVAGGALLANVGATGLDDWSIVVTDVYMGLPVYVLGVPILIPDLSESTQWASMSFNAAIIVFAIVAELVDDRRQSNGA